MLGEEKLINFTKTNYQKKITKVNERVYHFLGYGHSNAIAIIGETSIILIDTLDSDYRAKVMKDELAKISDKPVKTIIYTHGHPDHLGGAGAFRDTVVEVIAFKPRKPILKYYDRISKLLNQRGIYQHGYGLTDQEAISQGIGIREGKEIKEGKYDFIKPTTYYEQKVVERVIDGIKLKMVSAVGEADDEIYVWLEDDQIMCCGDNYYGCWPNLYAIRGTMYRDVATWIDCMNQGMSLEETVKNVKLAPIYQDKEYLGEYYGTVEWSVKSIYNGYVGWFDGDPVKLLPHPTEAYNQAVLALIGDNDKLILAIKNYMAQEDYQMALQLIELLMVQDNSLQIIELKKQALLMRAKQVTSANARHYLIACAKSL